MSDPNLSIQRQIQSLQFDVERIRKADTGLSAGSAFPSTPGTNLLFYRSDLGWLCYYDGTRWLTVHEYSAAFPQTAFTATSSFVIKPIRQDYAPYITRLSAQLIVLTTNSAINFWTILLRGVNSAYTTTTTIHTISTAALAVNTWANVDTAFPSGTVTPSNRALIDVSATVTGTPGTLAFSSNIDYRLIVT